MLEDYLVDGMNEYKNEWNGPMARAKHSAVSKTEVYGRYLGHLISPSVYKVSVRIGARAFILQ